MKKKCKQWSVILEICLHRLDLSAIFMPISRCIYFSFLVGTLIYYSKYRSTIQQINQC